MRWVLLAAVAGSAAQNPKRSSVNFRGFYVPTGRSVGVFADPVKK